MSRICLNHQCPSLSRMKGEECPASDLCPNFLDDTYSTNSTTSKTRIDYYDVVYDNKEIRDTVHTMTFEEKLKKWTEKIINAYTSYTSRNEEAPYVMINTYKMIKDVDKIIAEGFNHSPVVEGDE